MCEPSTLYRAAWSRPTRRQRSLGTHGRPHAVGLLTPPPPKSCELRGACLVAGIKAWVGPRVDTQHFTWYDDGTPAGTGPF